MKFSIGIPAYKAKYLKECIQSVLCQTCEDFELIIVNDASPDDLDSVIHEFEDGRIRYFKNSQNIGAANVVENWNKCLGYATGEYFILLGDDDVLSPEYLREFSDLILKYPLLDVFHCRSVIINESSQVEKVTPAWPEFETVWDSMWHRINGYRTQFVSDFVYRIKSLKDQGGFYDLPLAWASDDITSYIMMGEKGIAHINLPLFGYRNSGITISNTGNIPLKLKAIENEKLWFDKFLSASDCTGFDQLLKEQILLKLPDYIRKKRKSTIAQLFRTSYMAGLIAAGKELSDREISLQEFVVAATDEFVNTLKRVMKLSFHFGKDC